MLQEYFALNITEDGRLESLPILLNNYTPNLDRLPLLLMRLGPQVSCLYFGFCVAPFFYLTCIRSDY